VKILIDNSGYELKNHGDLSMLLLMVERLHNQYPKAEIQVFTVAADRLVKLIPYVTPVSIEGRKMWLNTWNVFGGLHKLFPSCLHNWLKDKEDLLKVKFPVIAEKWVIRRFRKRGVNVEVLSQFIQLVQQADVVVASGGGYLTDTFKGHALRVLKTLALAQEFRKPTAIFGQGLGPFESKELMYWMRRVLPKLVLITLRERLSSEPHALSMGAISDKVLVTGDDAIYLAYKRQPLNMGRKIGVNLRIAVYSGLDNNNLDLVKQVLEMSASNLTTELCGVPISFYEEDSDFQSIQKILGSNEADTEELDTPEKIIDRVGECRIVVTGSYHAGVFALSQGVSVIAIAASAYYRDKFDGLAEQFEVGCSIIDGDVADFENKLELAISDAWLKADELRPILLQKAEEQISLTDSAYLRLFNILNEK